MDAKSIDYLSDDFWKEVENQFYEAAKEGFQELRDTKTKNDKLYIFVNGLSEYPLFFMDPLLDDAEAEMGIQMDVEILIIAYEKYLEEEYDEYKYQERLYQHCGNVFNKLADENYFDGLFDEELSIIFTTLGMDWKTLCKVSRN